jgi:porin
MLTQEEQHSHWGSALLAERPGGYFALFYLTLSQQFLFLAVLSLLSLTTGVLPAKAADYSGPDVHRHRALRQFWRQLEEELEDQVDELEPEWFHHKHMTGDLAGQRSTFAAWGITPTLTYVSNILGNPVGGQHQKVAYDDNIGLDIDVDLEKLAGLKDLTFHVSGSFRSGRSLSKVAIANTFPVSSIFGGETIRLYELYFEQSILEDRVSLLIGRFGIGDEFLTSPLYSVFLNNAIDGNPISVPLNVPAFSSQSYPVAQWGFRAIVRPVQEWYVMAGISNGDRTLSRNSTHGVDFSFRSDADIFTVGEAGYLRNQQENATGLPGNYEFGGYYDAGPFPDLYHDKHGHSYVASGLPPRTAHNNYGFYLLIDQQIYREIDPKHNQGLIPFAGVTFAPLDINTFPFFFLAGLIYNGPIPGRDRDTAGLGIAYGQFSDELQRSQRLEQKLNGSSNGVQHFEMILELTYQIELAPHLIVQPDAQYIIRPGGTGNIPDALVLGVQIAINL